MSGNFFDELKRRNVYKVALAYIVGGWALSQGIAQVLPVFDVPNLIIRLLVVVIIIGFPIALIFAWAYEITPEGIKRAEDVDSDKPHTVHGPWIYIVIVSLRELSSSVLLYSPDSVVVSVVLWELWQNGQYVQLSALGVMMIAVLFAFVLAAHTVGRRFGVREV